MKLSTAYRIIIIGYIVAFFVGGNEVATNTLLLGILFFLYFITKALYRDK